MSQLEHLGIGGDLSKHEMRCVHAQVCENDSSKNDMITISSFVRFVNATFSEEKKIEKKDENRIRVKDGRTLTPRNDMHAPLIASRPGRVDLIVESVENVPTTSFVGRSDLYVRSRLLLSNNHSGKPSWKNTKSVLCTNKEETTTWTDHCTMIHRVKEHLDRSVAIVVELMDRDDMTPDDEDICIGRTTREKSK